MNVVFGTRHTTTWSEKARKTQSGWKFFSFLINERQSTFSGFKSISSREWMREKRRLKINGKEREKRERKIIWRRSFEESKVARLPYSHRCTANIWRRVRSKWWEDERKRMSERWKMENYISFFSCFSLSLLRWKQLSRFSTEKSFSSYPPPTTIIVLSSSLTSHSIEERSQTTLSLQLFLPPRNDARISIKAFKRWFLWKVINEWKKQFSIFRFQLSKFLKLLAKRFHFTARF